MEQRFHDFKKIERIGDAVVGLVSALVSYKIETDRIKANTLMAFLRSNKFLSTLAKERNLTVHIDDPVLQGSKKDLANAYEYFIGKLYLEDNQLGMIECEKDFNRHLYRQKDKSQLAYNSNTPFVNFHEPEN